MTVYAQPRFLPAGDCAVDEELADEISQEIFSSVEPYRRHVAKRTTFNSNDPIRQGVYSQVTRQSGLYAARAVLVVGSK